MRKTDPMKPNVDYLRRLGYERSDISLPILIKWMAFLVCFCLFCAGTVFVIMHVFVPELGKEPVMNPAGMSRVQSPNPELQGLPRRDLASFRQMENERLEKYGWVNQQAGTVHIPVDSAIDIIAKQGLPSRLPGPIPSTKPEPAVPGGGTVAAPNPAAESPAHPTPGEIGAPGISSPQNVPGGAANGVPTGPAGTQRNGTGP